MDNYKIVRTNRGILRLVHYNLTLDMSEIYRADILRTLNKIQTDELSSIETYYTEITYEQFKACMLILDE